MVIKKFEHMNMNSFIALPVSLTMAVYVKTKEGTDFNLCSHVIISPLEFQNVSKK